MGASHKRAAPSFSTLYGTKYLDKSQYFWENPRYGNCGKRTSGRARWGETIPLWGRPHLLVDYYAPGIARLSRLRCLVAVILSCAVVDAQAVVWFRNGDGSWHDPQSWFPIPPNRTGVQAVFDPQWPAKVLIERWRNHYNTVRPYSSLGYRPPAPEAIQTCPPDSGATPLRLPAMSEQEQTLT